MTDTTFCADHPTAPHVFGLCAACSIRSRIGSFNVELLEPEHTTGCRSTIHCANFGFCHRCEPELSSASEHVMKALSKIGREHDGRLYGRMMDLLMQETAQR